MDADEHGMNWKVDTSKTFHKETTKITQAAQMAFGNQIADEFFDEMLSHLPKYRKIFSGQDQQARAE